MRVRVVKRAMMRWCRRFARIFGVAILLTGGLAIAAVISGMIVAGAYVLWGAPGCGIAIWLVGGAWVATIATTCTSELSE
jgi:hypothetical protein